MTYTQYTVVELKELKREFGSEDNSVGDNLPQVGDKATVVEVYNDPTTSYELECVNENGNTNWLVTFSPNDAVFGVIYDGNPKPDINLSSDKK